MVVTRMVSAGWHRLAGLGSKRLVLAVMAVAAMALAADSIYLWAVWPNFDALARGRIPKSRFMTEFESDRGENRALPRMVWEPIALDKVPDIVVRAVVLAEDSRFFSHGGVDWNAVGDAARRNWEEGGIKLGASTISQQTAKNLFLTRSRTWLRKWHELWLTWGLERNLDKRRILSLYVNIVELGLGVYGVQAAAKHYWGLSAASLNRRQAAELAATLPSPRRDNPRSRTRRFLRRRERVLHFLAEFGATRAD